MFHRDPHLWEDVLVSIVLKKPVLLKGPSGSGKTKLAQSISHYFQSADAKRQLFSRSRC